MTTKQKIMDVISELPENTSFHAAMERLYVLCKIEEGLDDLAKGNVIDHDVFMKELDDLDAADGL